MRLLLATILLSLVAWSACAQPARLPVVATFSILGDLVRQVGGEAVEVTVLVPVDADAHSYQPRPSDIAAVAHARLIVRNGLGIDEWSVRLMNAARATAAEVVVSTGLTPRRLVEDGKSVADPHLWQDPRLAARYVAAITEALSQVDPAHADAYRARGEAFAREIVATDAAVERQLAGVPAGRRVLVTSHDAFGYFGARYGVRVLAVQGLSTEQEPSARAIAELSRIARRERVGTVFVENMTDPRLATALAREAGATLGAAVFSDALSPPDGPAPTYLAMLRHNAALFAAAMGAAPMKAATAP